jgi:hypothetical protein
MSAKIKINNYKYRISKAEAQPPLSQVENQMRLLSSSIEQKETAIVPWGEKIRDFRSGVLSKFDTAKETAGDILNPIPTFTRTQILL